MKTFAHVVFHSSLVVFLVACSGGSDSGKTRIDPVKTYNTVARDSAEAECACLADSSPGGTDECLDERFDPLVLSSCESDAVRCAENDFELYLTCRTDAHLAFQNCVSGCPSDLSECRMDLEDALIDCDAARSDELVAHFQTCRAGGSPVCSDPSFPDQPDAGTDAGGGGGDAGGNRAPSADAGADQSARPDTPVVLEGSGTDPDGDALTYSWQVIAQPVPSAPELMSEDRATAIFTSTTPGEYTLELVVDDGSLTDADQVVVTVSENDQPPTAVATATTPVVVGTVVTLDGTASSDDTDSIAELDFAWTFTVDPSGGADSLSRSRTETASFTPSSTGDYEIELTVTDSAGNTASDTVVVTVFDGPCVIISEYIEGSAENRAVEIFNCGASTVDLGRVAYCSEPNDTSIPSDGCYFYRELSGTLASGEVYVICHPNFEESQRCDQTMNGLNFAGDDRIAITYDDDNDDSFTYGSDTILDVLGQLGQRPTDPSVWQNKGLRRCNFTPNDGQSAFDHTDYYVEAVASVYTDLGTPPTETCAP